MKQDTGGGGDEAVRLRAVFARPGYPADGDTVYLFFDRGGILPGLQRSRQWRGGVAEAVAHAGNIL